MADIISNIPIRFLKIHQLQIISDTVLATLFSERPFRVFEYEEYLNFIVDFLERLTPEIVIQRLFATAPYNILVAPRWKKSRYQILKDIENTFIQRDTFQGTRYREAVASNLH